MYHFDAGEWREELGLVVVYRMLECGDIIPVDTDGTDYSFIENTLQELFNNNLIDISLDGLHWEPTQKGVALRDKMVSVYDRLIKCVGIFGSVCIDMELDTDVSEDGMFVFDHCYDPRFSAQDGYDVQDLRLAMLEFIHNEMKDDSEFSGEPSLNKRRIVFFQMLADGEFNGDIWFDLRLGTKFKLIDEIISTAYPWNNLARTDEEAASLMTSIYTAGRLEERKRDGYECSKCGIPLAVFELSEKENGRVLTKCPNPDCNEPFIPPEPEGEIFECPNCDSEVGTHDSQCINCGALLDYSMPEGSVVEEEDVVEEPVWHSPYYDYLPYGWYDPYDPYYDMVAFSMLCVALW